uniref:Uncharacterized protein n=1 Tax=Avena sativa TaxID=4498 RepID=A0ACD5VAT6_AVESA
MDYKYMNRFHTAILLSVLLLACFATHARCRTVEGMEKSVKDDSPYGACVPARGCEHSSICLFCCSLKDQCYEYLDECKADCSKSTSPLDQAAAAATNRAPPAATNRAPPASL